jgi:hypothetical protein
VVWTSWGASGPFYRVGVSGSGPGKVVATAGVAGAVAAWAARSTAWPLQGVAVRATQRPGAVWGGAG